MARSNGHSQPQSDGPRGDGGVTAAKRALLDLGRTAGQGDPVAELVRRYPGRAMVAGFAAGVFMGISPTARRVARTAFEGYAAATLAEYRRRLQKRSSG